MMAKTTPATSKAKQRRARAGGIAKAKNEHGGKVLDTLLLGTAFHYLTGYLTGEKPLSKSEIRKALEFMQSANNPNVVTSTQAYQLAEGVYSPFMAVKVLSQKLGYSHRHIARVLKSMNSNVNLSMPHKQKT